MIAAGANKKKIKMTIMKKRGKPVLMKTLLNLQTKIQNTFKKGPITDLQKLHDALVAVPGSKARFVSNEKNELVGKFI